MSEPKEREEWMPSKEVGLAATLGSYNVPRIDREFHRTGLRAQIAVLENVYSEDHPDEVCENIEYKIASLRKELEG